MGYIEVYAFNSGFKQTN